MVKNGYTDKSSHKTDKSAVKSEKSNKVKTENKHSAKSGGSKKPNIPAMHKKSKRRAPQKSAAPRNYTENDLINEMSYAEEEIAIFDAMTKAEKKTVEEMFEEYSEYRSFVWETYRKPAVTVTEDGTEQRSAVLSIIIPFSIARSSPARPIDKSSLF